MALHRLTSITIGVPNVAETAAYYTDFGLDPARRRRFGTADGGEQLELVRRSHPPAGRARRRRRRPRRPRPHQPPSWPRLDVAGRAHSGTGSTEEPVTGYPRRHHVAPRIAQETTAADPPTTAPAASTAPTGAHRGVMREGPVAPRKLGHVVIGTTDHAATQRFFTDGLGFKVSDDVKGIGAFMRCSTDHHNVLVQPAPVQLPAPHLLAGRRHRRDRPRRHSDARAATPSATSGASAATTSARTSSGTSRTRPATSPSTTPTWTASPTTQLWKPGVWEGAKGLYNWGPPPPPSFLAPDDLAALMTGAHSAG